MNHDIHHRSRGRSIPTTLWISLVVTLCVLLGAHCPRTELDVQVITLDYSAPSSGFNVDWHFLQGPLTFANVKRYPVTIRLNTAPATAFTLIYEVKENRSWASDPLLGLFSATWQVGSVTPSEILYRANAGASHLYPFSE